MSSIVNNILYSNSLLGLSTNTSDAISTGRDAVLESRNATANQFAVVNHIENSTGNWIGIQDSLSEGLLNIAFVQINDEGLQQIESLLLTLKSEIESGATLDSLTSIENQISQVVGENQILQTGSISIMSMDADLSQEASLTSFKDYAEILSLSNSDVPQEMLFLEVNMSDVINAYHAPDQCPVCQAAQEAIASDGGVLTNSDGTPVAIMNMAAATTTTTGLPGTTSTAGGDATIDPLIMGYKWDISSGDPLTWSLYNGTAAYDDPLYASEAYDDTAASMAAWESEIQDAFQLWDNASALSFSQVTETAANVVGDIRVAYSDTMPLNSSTPDPDDRAAAFALAPFTTAFGGDVWFDSGAISGYLGNQTLTPGAYGFQTALHEFGHAIGLSHPFGSASVGNDNLSGIEDSNRYSIMSYNQQTYDRSLIPVNFTATYSGGSVSWGWEYANAGPIGPMLYDVAAVEYLYGVSTDTELGNTSYQANLSGFFTIVDSGGDDDVIDASAESTDSVINLAPGSFSSIGTTTEAAYADAMVLEAISQVTSQGGTLSASAQATIRQSLLDGFAAKDGASISGEAMFLGQDNIAIASTANIENAIGGNGNDTITGNALDNVIKGGDGNDAIDGSGGTNTAVYTGVMSNYTITDNGDGTFTVADNSGTEGTDTLSNIRYIEFSDQTYDTTDTSTVATATSALAASLAASPAFAVVGTAPQAAAPSGASSNPSSGGGSSSPHGYGSLFGVGGNSALAMIDRAMETVSNERAKLGAILNRLESRRDAIMSEMDNTKAAISPIRDTDYAITMTRFIKEQIRQQVAYTMLGHANMSIQQVTTLLK